MTLIDKAEALAIAQSCPDSHWGPWIAERIAALPARGVAVKPPLSIRDWVAPDHDYRPSMDPDDQGDCAECGNSASWHNPPALAPTAAAQAPFRIEDMTLADLMRDPLYEEATTPDPDAAQAREAAQEHRLIAAAKEARDIAIRHAALREAVGACDYIFDTATESGVAVGAHECRTKIKALMEAKS